jgi:hypothetical protein
MSFELEIPGLAPVVQVWDGLARPAPGGSAGFRVEGLAAPLMATLAAVLAGA